MARRARRPSPRSARRETAPPSCVVQRVNFPVVTPKSTCTSSHASPALGGSGAPDVEVLLELLADRAIPPDSLLPDTGVGIERERILGSRFILDPTYGTRSSTVVVVDADGGASVVERSFDAAGAETGERRHTLAMQP